MNAATTLKNQRPAAQEYWHKVMTVADRTQVIIAIGHVRGESEKAYYHRALDYVTQTQGAKVEAFRLQQVAEFLKLN